MAANFMKAGYLNIKRIENIIPVHLLEAWRLRLYKEIPVYDGWHEQYAHGSADTERYINRAREVYKWFAY